MELGFKRASADHCVYIKNSGDGKLILGLHVDDFIMAGNPPAIARFKNDMSARFKIKDLGDAKLVVGIQIHQDDSGISLTQSTYIRDVIQVTGMSDAAPANLPAIGGEVNQTIAGWDVDNEPPPTNPTEFKRIIGKTIYAMVGTRPDIAYAVGMLGRFASRPNTHHLAMAKRLLRYLKGNPDVSIKYPRGQGTATIIGYSDADWGGSEDRKSTTGYLFTINGAPVSWCSKRQPTVALSSTEAEYMAATQATKEAIWLRRLLADLGHPQAGPTSIREDNQGAISLARNPVHHARTKHIDIQHHFVREKVEGGCITLDYCPTNDQIADLLTKPLVFDRFYKFFSLLNL
jgi:hypothetical protein